MKRTEPRQVESNQAIVEPAPAVRVWDLPTRLFHWLLALLVGLQFATAEFGWWSMQWHYRFGYVILALIAFRLVWGFLGSQTSRFGDFVRGPVTVARYLRAQLDARAATARTSKRIGHNPLGGWSVLVMLGLLSMQAISGLFASDGIDEDGPYADAVSNVMVKRMTRLHHLGETALLVVIALHVAAVLLHWAIKRDNLIAPMLSGRKRVESDSPRFFVGSGRAAVVFAVALALVILLARFGS